jgi:hypothetical protein
MKFYVLGSDGNQYGPADVPTLKQWALEGRIQPTTSVKNADTGDALAASGIPGLFPDYVAPEPAPLAVPESAAPAMTVGAAEAGYGSQDAYRQSYSAQPRATQPVGALGDSFFWRAVIYSILALPLYFAFGGFAFFWAGCALFYGIRCKTCGDRRGPLAIGVAVICLVLIALGCFMRVGAAAP